MLLLILVEHILPLHKGFLSDLEAEIENWPNVRLSVPFTKLAPFLKMYSTVRAYL